MAKCKLCEWYRKGECVRASEGNVGDIEETSCLLKLQISLLKDIWVELTTQSDDRDEGEDWKLPP